MIYSSRLIVDIVEAPSCKIPERIRIYSSLYTVVLSTKIVDEVKGGLMDGDTDFENKIISLCQFLPRNDKPQVYLRELIRAIMFENGSMNRLGADLERTISESLAKFFSDKYKMRLK
jgi:hypothetical protein